MEAEQVLDWLLNERLQQEHADLFQEIFELKAKESATNIYLE